MNGSGQFQMHMIRRTLNGAKGKSMSVRALSESQFIKKTGVALNETLVELRRRGHVAFNGELRPETVVVLTAPHLVEAA